MYYLGIDLGSSSIKIALIDSDSGKPLSVVQEPENEMAIHAPKTGWAEQHPEDWWQAVCLGIQKIKKTHNIHEKDIKGIGIAYQMHGLVVLDKEGNPLRNAIIWCDSRAVAIGHEAFEKIGASYCKENLLNSPANFTASKLAWVKKQEPEIYTKVYKFMLPGDYLAFRFTGQMTTTISGLSEGILWNFKKGEVASKVLDHFDFDAKLIPQIVDTLGIQGQLSSKGATESGLVAGTPILYRAGDQPNNALALNILRPGEMAATGGTSGVIYAITDSLSSKESERVNNFAHVNYHIKTDKVIGKLLCINGAGILYRWLRNNLKVNSYEQMNTLASSVPAGCDGLSIIPFGNGAERMLNNQNLGAHILNLDLNRHNQAHICRAALEGIAFSFVYGFNIMKADEIQSKVMRAGNDNLFRSKIFATTLATLIEQKIEIHNTTGAIGAARACIISQKGYAAFSLTTKNDFEKAYIPNEDKEQLKVAYNQWNKELQLINNKIASS
ncbi:MAG: carbohydrate kinase [Croceitalea sp.]|nr:carbohydrate kinase [Croceitalea sp.]